MAFDRVFAYRNPHVADRDGYTSVGGETVAQAVLNYHPTSEFLPRNVKPTTKSTAAKINEKFHHNNST